MEISVNSFMKILHSLGALIGRLSCVSSGRIQDIVPLERTVTLLMVKKVTITHFDYWFWFYHILYCFILFNHIKYVFFYFLDAA